MTNSKTIIKELALNGKLITSADPALIGNNFQTYKNLRYGEKAPEGVLGMNNINPDVLINEMKATSGFHFKKDQPAESHVLLQAYSSLTGYSTIRQNITAIPNEGNFESTGLFVETTGYGKGMYSYAPNGQMAYCNGKDSCLWAGDEIRIARFINYKESDATIKYDFTELVDNNDSSKYATLVNDTANCYIYLGFTRLPNKVKFYIGTGNTNAATMAMHYWNGIEWSGPQTITDGTSSGGATLNKTGTINFNMTTSIPFCPREVNGIYLYWVRLTTSALLSSTTVYYCTTNYLFQPIRDIWDGEYRSSLSFQIHKTSYEDYSLNVHEDSYDSENSATFAVVGGVTSAQYLVAGFPEKLTGMVIHLKAGGSNSTASTTLTIKYWNGTTWAAPEWSEDGTSEGSIAFAKSGVIQWKPPAISSEHKTEIAGRGAKKGKRRRIGEGTIDNLPLYYYQISFDKTLSTDCAIYYVAGIPAPKSYTYNYIGRYSFPVFAKERLWLGCDTDKEKNKAICSMRNAPDVWNGDDTTEFFFGDDSALTCGCSLYSRLGSSIYNVLLFLKANAVYGITGNSPDDFIQYEISNTVGCVAPRTLKTTVLSVAGNIKPIAIWQGANGIYIFDNTSPELKSMDISDIFDKSSSTYINPNKIADSVAFIDENKKEYHWLFASGASTTLNKEFVYDLNKDQWFEIDRGSGKYLQLGFEVSDNYGNSYCYGCADEGYMQRLEYGTTFDDNAIVHTLKTGDIAPYNGSIMYESQLIRHKIIMKSKNTTSNNLTITHYGDSAESGTALTSADPTKTAYRITDIIDNLNIGNHIFHALEYTMTTTDETKGFSPLFIGMKFNVLGEDLS